MPDFKLNNNEAGRISKRYLREQAKGKIDAKPKGDAVRAARSCFHEVGLRFRCHTG